MSQLQTFTENNPEELYTPVKAELQPTSETKSYPSTIATSAETSHPNSRRLSWESEFPAFAPSALPVFYRSYSRRDKETGRREMYKETIQRVISGLSELGKLTEKETKLISDMAYQFKCLPSGRWLWVGGTKWCSQQKNFSGGYNCTSTDIIDVQSIGTVMELAMMGCGCGANLEKSRVEKLGKITAQIQIKVKGEFGSVDKSNRIEQTLVKQENEEYIIIVGDSREGWRDSVNTLIELAMTKKGIIKLTVDISNIRKTGEPLFGFGGTANPIRLPEMYTRIAKVLSKAINRQLTPVEVCLILDECALCVVAGNIRRSAGMRQFSSNDMEAACVKENLWVCDENGKWRTDPEREALRMANHTRVWHEMPDYKTIEDSIKKQFLCGEGAIQFAPEAIARGNADLLDNKEKKQEFIRIYTEESHSKAGAYLEQLNGIQFPAYEYEHRLNRHSLNPCGEIIGKDFHCNLSEVHLNMLNPDDEKSIKQAFKAGAISVSCLLHHQFLDPRYAKSAEIDPIVGVSFTGLFDHFVQKFGAEWLQWFAAGRPKSTAEGIKYNDLERKILSSWREIVKKQVKKYCCKHNLKMPNRYTTVQPAGTKSLLTGASAGWHPPKAQRFIRRIIFDKNNPLVKALRDWGYNVIPDSSARDEKGMILDDVNDSRVREVLVEIPTEVIWANQPGVQDIDINKFSAIAQFDFYMNIQNYYTTHNTSATIEFREPEIPSLAHAIHDAIQNNNGYISLALLARFDANETFPRLPFEPISQETYIQMVKEVNRKRKELSNERNFFEVLQEYDSVKVELTGAAGCDSDKCLFALQTK